MAWQKKFKKSTGKMSTAVKKRYGIGKGRGGFKFQKLASDLAEVKSRLNVEKKFVDSDLVNDQIVGQSNDENPGYYVSDATPSIPQSTGESGRIGNSLKITGMVVRMNFRQQANAGKRIAKVCVIRSRTDDPETGVISDLWDANPLTGFIDFHSNLNYTGRRGKNSSHQIIATRYCKVEDTGGGEDGVGTIKFSLKLSDILRYATNGSNDPEDFRYRMVVFLDYGNSSSLATTQNAGCLIGGQSTGCLLNHQVRHWYVDN